MMDKMKKLKNAKKGFTLIEMIVVLVIIAILAAIAIPSLTGYIGKAKDKQILTEARTVYVATQAIASQNFADGKATAADNEAAITADKINNLVGETLIASDAGAFTVTTDDNGNVTGMTYTKNGKIATYNGSSFDISNVK